MCRQPTNTSAPYAACHCKQPATPYDDDDDDDRYTIFIYFIPKSASSPSSAPSPLGGNSAGAVVVAILLEGSSSKEDHGSEGGLREVRAILGIALPIVLIGLLLYSCSMISILFLGQLGELPLVGGALVIGFANITGYSISSGLAMDMEPICGQAFDANRKSLLGLTMQCTIMSLLCICVPIFILWISMRRILVLCGQDAEIFDAAYEYILASLPASPPAKNPGDAPNEDALSVISLLSQTPSLLPHHCCLGASAGVWRRRRTIDVKKLAAGSSSSPSSRSTTLSLLTLSLLCNAKRLKWHGGG